MADPIDFWGIVELMGHSRCAGRMSEQTIAGAALLRVDIPDGNGGFRTAYYGPSAIYAIHPTDEKVARLSAQAMGREPPYVYQLNQLIRQLPSPQESDEIPFDAEDR